MDGNIWEDLWSQENSAALLTYLKRFYRLKSQTIDLLRAHGARRVCDAACGYGGFSLALASNGFEVYSFDVSPSAAEFTRKGLEHYGFDGTHVKTADILSTGYERGFFDAAVANSVLDHMRVSDAKRALSELCRITMPGGLICLSLDRPEEDDRSFPHELLDDGSILYTAGSRRGMLLHPYTQAEALRLLADFELVYTEPDPEEEQVFIFKNPA